MKDKFVLLIDDSLVNLSQSQELKNQLEKKYILSYLNNFENAEWRYKHFNRFIFDNLCEAALSESERAKIAIDPCSAMVNAAKKLRFSEDSGRGSELAEIFLYGVMKRHYRALPVVPKIFYKQNTQDNAKGADSVHIVLEDNGSFTLWYGESKFYNNLKEAMKYAIESVKHAIADEKISKENSIVTSMSDLELLVKDKVQLNNIKTMLSPDTSLDRIKPILHIPILLLHECSATAQQQQMTEEYREQLKSNYRSQAQIFFQKLNTECINVYLYQQITFHLILFPVPNKERIVELFTERANTLKEG